MPARISTVTTWLQRWRCPRRTEVLWRRLTLIWSRVLNCLSLSRCCLAGWLHAKARAMHPGLSPAAEPALEVTGCPRCPLWGRLRDGLGAAWGALPLWKPTQQHRTHSLAQDNAHSVCTDHAPQPTSYVEHPWAKATAAGGSRGNSSPACCQTSGTASMLESPFLFSRCRSLLPPALGFRADSINHLGKGSVWHALLGCATEE